MTKKERFLQNILDKIEALNQSYIVISTLSDDVFEDHDTSKAEKKTKPLNGHKKTPSENKEYGTNINSVRELLRNAPNGMSKSEIVSKFPDSFMYDHKELTTIITNVLSSLNKGDEIEGVKPKGKKMRGFIWKLKA